jgi:hypothetical protein
MGRLDYLKRTLPSWVAQAGSEVIVVDYSCPDRCGDWVATTYPSVKVVTVEGEQHFSASRARNAGAAVASGRWLCMVDADVLVSPAFTHEISALLDEQSYLRNSPGDPDDLTGTALIPRVAFHAAGGYDEAMSGWGCEDIDLYLRLQQRGLRRAPMPSLLLRALPHDDELRTRFAAIRSRDRTFRINRLYVEAKFAFWRMMGSPPSMADRRALYNQVSAAVMAHGDVDEVRVELSLGRGPRVTGAPVEYTIVLAMAGLAIPPSA